LTEGSGPVAIAPGAVAVGPSVAISSTAKSDARGDETTSPFLTMMRGVASASNHFRIFPPAVEEPRIVLQWLARLRWMAVAGQALATLAAVWLLKLQLPLLAINSVIVFTALSNIGIQIFSRRRVWPGLVPAVLMLDVCLLTTLLICSGGPANPFSVLYLVHVAMAVVTLGEGWSWLVVAATALCYGLLYLWHRPLVLPTAVASISEWVGLVLVAGLIAYFVGRMTRSLRQHEKDLAVARERAARNEQLAALTTLAAGAAHELNTPLGTIAVIARELEVQSKQLQLQESVGQDAQLIRQEVDRCQVILGRMRVDVLHGEPRKTTTLPADRFVAELRDELRQVTGCDVKIECSPSIKEISVPLRAVQQALGILVDNAVDACGGRDAVKLSINARQGRLIFEVVDQGVGMPGDVLRRAGEPFFTTKPPGNGMGLGLFLVRLVAEKLGGSLDLYSEPGVGTRAVFELPGME
jgi:two-component system sensor histidine kinase RegB